MRSIYQVLRIPSVAVLLLVGNTFALLPLLSQSAGSASSSHLRGARESMAFIRGGTTFMGVNAADVTHFAQTFGISHLQLFEDEEPKHRVLVKDFLIDKYLVTNSQFKKFLDLHPEWQPGKMPPSLDNGNYLRHWANGSFPASKADHPIVNVNWYAATAYCASLGKRLPTEAEWEYAAKGGLQSSLFPWGNKAASPKRANYSENKLHTTTRVGSYRPNGYGLYDMAGNVWEFLSDEWGKYPPDGQDNGVQARSSVGESLSYLQVRTRRVIRGGSFDGDPVNLWVEYRDSHPPNGSQAYVGFRCAE